MSQRRIAFQPADQVAGILPEVDDRAFQLGDGEQLDVLVQGLGLGLLHEADARHQDAAELRRNRVAPGAQPAAEGVILGGIDRIRLILALDDVRPRKRPAAVFEEEVDLPSRDEPVGLHAVAEQLEKHTDTALEGTALGRQGIHG